MKMREKINFKLEEISLEEIPVLSGDNGESKKAECQNCGFDQWKSSDELNPYWQISGTFLRPFYWKTHPSKNYEHLFSFLNSGRELDQFTGKFIQSSKWMSFPVKRSSSRSQN